MRHYCTLVILLLLATATRLYQIASQSIWFDEGWSAFAAIQPTLLSALEADPTNPPLYYGLLNIITHGFGDSAFSLRWVSTLIGLLTIPLAYQLARRLFDQRAGLFAAFLVTFSPLMWWAAQEARMYTLLAVLVLLMALAWHQLLMALTRWAWLTLLLAELGLLYAHNTGPVVVLWINAVMLLVWLSRRSLRRPDWRWWFLGQFVVGLLWLPWFVTRFLDVQTANSALISGPQIGLPLLSQIWQAFWLAPWALVGQVEALTRVAGGVLVVALFFIPWRRGNARWLVGHVVVLVAGLIFGLSYIGNEMHGRYLVMIAPLLLVAVGAGIARLKLAVLRYALAVAFAILFVSNLLAAQNPAYQHDDVRGMAQYYADTLTAADTVLAWSYADRYDLAYYWKHLNIPARRVTLPEGADLGDIAHLLPDDGQVALNVWYTQRADFRGMMTCVLGHGTVNLPVEHTVYGMSNWLYSTAPGQLPTTRPFERPVLHNGTPIAAITGSVDLSPMTADQALCVPIALRLNQAVESDLRAAVIVRNSLGQDIAQTSAVFATANQRTTAMLAPGESAVAYALLRLPYGAPPGDYDLLLRVFDDTLAPSGYDMVSEDGHIIGNDLPLGVWRVRRGAAWAQTNQKTALPNRVDLAVNENLVLRAHDIQPMTISPGSEVPLQLLWQGRGQLPDLSLRSVQGRWAISLPPQSGLRDNITLDWRVLRVPVDVGSGTALLLLPDGTVLAEYQIDALPRLNDQPDFAVSVDKPMAELGRLVGYTSDHDSVDHNEPLAVTLIWQAGDVTADVSYTVFVQLLADDGRLIAQSDSLPAQGERPTTGWRAGEYIVDEHMLRFNENAAPGEARLIVGLYDAQTGTRLSVGPDGQDFIELPGVITVR